MSDYDRVEIDIVGKVFGFRRKDESDEAASSRIILEAEQFGNTGESRIHLQRARKLFPLGVIEASEFHG